jgi:hypothetical protein
LPLEIWHTHGERLVYSGVLSNTARALPLYGISKFSDGSISGSIPRVFFTLPEVSFAYLYVAGRDLQRQNDMATQLLAM